MSAHKVVNFVAFHGENLKMGKDERRIERGKCACGECEDFMRSDGRPSHKLPMNPKKVADKSV